LKCDQDYDNYALGFKIAGLGFSIEAITVLDGTLLLEEIMQARQVINS